MAFLGRPISWVNSVFVHDNGQKLDINLDLTDIMFDFHGHEKNYSPDDDKASRVLTQILSNSCGIEIFQEHDPVPSENNKSSSSEEIDRPEERNQKEEPTLRYERNTKRARKFMSIFIPIWSCRIIFYIIYQYLYDVCLAQLNYHKARMSQVGQNDSLRLIVETAQKQTDHYRSILKTMGAPFMNYNFLTESVIFYGLVASGLFHFAPRVLYRRLKNYNFGVMRAFLDEKRDRYIVDQLVLAETDKFLASNRNYIRFGIQKDRQKNRAVLKISKSSIRSARTRETNHKVFLHTDPNFSETMQTKSHHIENYSIISNMLAQMLESGHLMPLNRSNSWLFFLRYLYKILILILFVITITFVTIHMIVLPGFTNFTGTKLETEPLDCILLLETILLTGLHIVNSMFFIGVSISNTMDQLFAIRELRKAVEICIRIGSIRFWHLKNSFETISDLANVAPDRARSISLTEMKEIKSMKKEIETHSMHMNKNLLFVVMHYKIFIAQLKPLLRTLGPIALIIGLIVATAPIIIRFHLPYYSEYSRAVMLSLCLLSFIWCDTCFIPLCLCHSRILDLHRDLFDLLAHAIQVQSETEDLYDAHAVWILRKQLGRLDWQMGQFAVAFGLEITYSSLMKLHFWSGLVMLSAIMYSMGLIAGDILEKDPLGIFDIREAI